MVRRFAVLPDRLAGLGILLLGLGWGAGTFLANQDVIEKTGIPFRSALALVTVGCIGSVAMIWLGFGAVLWAMCRGLGARVPFLRVFWQMSATAMPLWLVAPCAAFLAAGASAEAQLVLSILLLAGLGSYTSLLASQLQSTAGLSSVRAWGGIGLAATFCASVLSLTA